MLPGLLGEEAANRPGAVVFDSTNGFQLTVAEGGETLRQQYQLRTGGSCVGDQACGCLQVGLHIRTTDHLYGGYV